jgi:hypothetical protein
MWFRDMLRDGLVINGQNKQLYWNWDDNVIRIYDPGKNEWKDISYETLSPSQVTTRTSPSRCISTR